MIIGITGGTGSGKTTLLELVRELGGLVLDCDGIYHNLLKTDKKLLSAVENRFPGCVNGGVLDRKKLGSIVFSDKQSLKDLNRITHSAVKANVLQQLENRPALTAIDAIGLFEGGLAELCDVTVAVTAPEDVRIARLIARDGITEEYAKKRIAAQPSTAKFAALCDYVLENSGTVHQFRSKCVAFFRDLGIITSETGTDSTGL
ncbi:MAG: dephospho-CoA kinase [Oscillospiraceae bacterium]|nr:dephospho-CoA kinase [Oscillospiraceae bacterium]